MKPKIPYSLVKTVDSATLIQETLKSQVITTDQFNQINYIAGVDVGFQDDGKLSQAAIAILSFPELKLVETQIATIPTTFPYIPGFLSFREIPAILKGLETIKINPDLIICDGQGFAHPRRFGLACHLGVILDIPTIGVAKTRFIGEHKEVDLEKGSYQPLIDQGETVGVVLRSRTNVKPIYVSIGHKISLTTAIDFVLKCTPKYRLPETTRYADHLASNR